MSHAQPDEPALGILAIADWCARVAAESEALFKWCGIELRAATDGAEQRWWATATQRHVWHAELARDRMPTIPLVDGSTLIAQAKAQVVARVQPEPTGDPLERWNDRVGPTLQLLHEVDECVDRRLDPGTVRVAELVEADLRSLREGPGAF